jgi:hypothetical protein
LWDRYRDKKYLIQITTVKEIFLLKKRFSY